MVIDVHTHIDEEDILQSYMRKAKNWIDLAFVIHWYKDNLEEVARFVSSKPNLRLIASVDIDGPEHIQRQLEAIDPLFSQKKIIGVKLYPGYQHFYVSDSRTEPVAELCLKYHKPLVIHTGDVYDTENEAILKYSHPIHIDEIAMKFPELKIVVAHFGFPYLLECANVVSKNKNVYTDISGTIVDDMPPKDALALYNEYKKDLKRIFNYFPDIRNKIMFGTDYGGGDITPNEIELYLKLVRQIFTKPERDHVFSGLAQRIFLE